MSTIRRTVKQENPFAQIDKTLLNDVRISWKTKGILSYLLSKPDDWTIRVQDLVNRSPDGRYAVASAIKEMQEFGYLIKEKTKRDRGKFDGYDYVVSELSTCPEKKRLKKKKIKPSRENSNGSTASDFPRRENRRGKTDAGNRAHTNKEGTDNEFSNNDESEKGKTPPQNFSEETTLTNFISDLELFLNDHARKEKFKKELLLDENEFVTAKELFFKNCAENFSNSLVKSHNNKTIFWKLCDFCLLTPKISLSQGFLAKMKGEYQSLDVNAIAKRFLLHYESTSHNVTNFQKRFQGWLERDREGSKKKPSYITSQEESRTTKVLEVVASRKDIEELDYQMQQQYKMFHNGAYQDARTDGNKLASLYNQLYKAAQEQGLLDYYKYNLLEAYRTIENLKINIDHYPKIEHGLNENPFQKIQGAFSANRPAQKQESSNNQNPDELIRSGLEYLQALSVIGQGKQRDNILTRIRRLLKQGKEMGASSELVEDLEKKLSVIKC